MKTAKNQALDAIRSNRTKAKFAEDLSLHLESEWTLTQTLDDAFQDSNSKDDQLRMIFMCYHRSIKPENNIPFILKALCGFSVNAIARALIQQEEPPLTSWCPS